MGLLRANCYFVENDNRCLIIDPADEADFILDEVQRKKLNPIAMLATHGHFDHILAAGEIQLSFKIPLFISQKDLFLVKRLNETARHFLEYDPKAIAPIVVKDVNEGELVLDGFELEAIATPGHTPGSMSFYFAKEMVLLSGDTLFKGCIGRYDFSYSRKKDLQKSLRKLLNLPESTIVYPGHGEETTIAQEKKIMI